MDSNSKPPSEVHRAAAPPPSKEEGWSLRVAVIAGIPIRLHITFVVLLIWLAIPSRTGAGSSFMRLLFVGSIFFCVLLHELGHALAARHYKIATRDIILTPIGGIASIEESPKPRQELWIALAGPAVNFVIAGVLFVVLSLMKLPLADARVPQTLPQFLQSLLSVNLTLALFNLLPVFPMDGGRVLRALMAHVMSETVATQIAARLGQFIALLAGVYGFFSGEWQIAFIAVFIYMAAGQEANAQTTKVLATGHRAREAMLRDFITLPVGSSFQDAADALLAGSQHDFPIMNGKQVVGVLTRSALLRGLATEGADAYIAGAMERDFLFVAPDAELSSLMVEIQGRPHSPILVMEGETAEEGHLLGMVTQENLLEFFMLAQIQSLRQNRDRASR